MDQVEANKLRRTCRDANLAWQRAHKEWLAFLQGEPATVRTQDGVLVEPTSLLNWGDWFDKRQGILGRMHEAEATWKEAYTKLQAAGEPVHGR